MDNKIKAQGAVEYLILIGGAVLVAAVVITLLSGSLPGVTNTANETIGNIIDIVGGGSGNTPPDNIVDGDPCQSSYDTDSSDVTKCAPGTRCNNPYEQGTLTIPDGGGGIDYCVGESATLIEYFCINNAEGIAELGQEPYDCASEDLICAGGACVAGGLPPVELCASLNDTDSAGYESTCAEFEGEIIAAGYPLGGTCFNPDVRGIVRIGGNESPPDECVGGGFDRNVREYFCANTESGPVIDSVIYDCDYFEGCSQGKCGGLFN